MTYFTCYFRILGLWRQGDAMIVADEATACRAARLLLPWFMRPFVKLEVIAPELQQAWFAQAVSNQIACAMANKTLETMSAQPTDLLKAAAVGGMQ